MFMIRNDASVDGLFAPQALEEVGDDLSNCWKVYLEIIWICIFG